MNHDSYRELLALKFYGEADAKELRRLAQHLASCGDCRAFEHELQADLERIPGMGTRVIPAAPGRQRTPLLVAAAAILGFLLGTLLPLGQSQVRDPADEALQKLAGERPPVAESRGGLSRLAAYWPR